MVISVACINHKQWPAAIPYHDTKGADDPPPAPPLRSTSWCAKTTRGQLRTDGRQLSGSTSGTSGTVPQSATLATMADKASEASKATFTSVKAALTAMEQGQPCLHLDLTKPKNTAASKPMTTEELAELVDALPRLPELKTLILACMYCMAKLHTCGYCCSTPLITLSSDTPNP